MGIYIVIMLIRCILAFKFNLIINISVPHLYILNNNSLYETYHQLLVYFYS